MTTAKQHWLKALNVKLLPLCASTSAKNKINDPIISKLLLNNVQSC